eukprot:TRINITY_DN409_c0_g1_i2.p1 TRINITY_DN409_c0_g1~~TRINITY_DN409_c0_g1_i2.p1  ORF type:complete len:339 (+),score=72.40 TRINITY_DN409_c0_g1_i2:556-1572(+)
MSTSQPWGSYVPFKHPEAPFWRNAVHIVSLRDPILRFLSYVVHIAFRYDLHEDSSEEWNPSEDENHRLIDKLMRFEPKELGEFSSELEHFLIAVMDNDFEEYVAEPVIFPPIDEPMKRKMKTDGPGVMTWSLSGDEYNAKAAACNLNAHYSAVVNFSEKKDMTAFILDKVLHFEPATLADSTTRFSGLGVADNLLNQLPSSTRNMMHMAFAADICIYKYGMYLMKKHAISLGYEAIRLKDSYPEVDCATLGLGDTFEQGPSCGALMRSESSARFIDPGDVTAFSELIEADEQAIDQDSQIMTETVQQSLESGMDMEIAIVKWNQNSITPETRPAVVSE